MNVPLSLKRHGISVLNRMRDPGPPLPYERYLRLERLFRARRRESILICEHPPTITAGVQSRSENLLRPLDHLEREGVPYYSIGRGGDHTAHEPGQAVIYLHVDLKRRGIPLSPFLRHVRDTTRSSIESVWSVPLVSDSVAPGLYSRSSGFKIVSMGLKIKEGFTGFGLSVNLNNDLSTFRHIVPCGHAHLKVGSLEREGADPGLLSDFLERWLYEFEEGLGPLQESVPQ